MNDIKELNDKYFKDKNNNLIIRRKNTKEQNEEYIASNGELTSLFFINSNKKVEELQNSFNSLCDIVEKETEKKLKTKTKNFQFEKIVAEYYLEEDINVMFNDMDKEEIEKFQRRL